MRWVRGSVQGLLKNGAWGSPGALLCPLVGQEGQWESLSSISCRTHLAPVPLTHWTYNNMSPSPVIIGHVPLSRSSRQVLTH